MICAAPSSGKKRSGLDQLGYGLLARRFFRLAMKCYKTGQLPTAHRAADRLAQLPEERAEN